MKRTSLICQRQAIAVAPSFTGHAPGVHPVFSRKANPRNRTLHQVDRFFQRCINTLLMRRPVNRFTSVTFLFFVAAAITGTVAAQQTKLKGSRVLVYTKNGKGYVHDNIPSAVAAIQAMGKEQGFVVDVADTSLVFTPDNLKKYTMLIFASTNNDVFATDDQRLAFRRYIEAGGGFVGIHSVTGTERNWHWFKMMVGETFTWHAKYQRFTVKKIDPEHPSMKDVPAEWSREDECYFGKELYPGMRVLMAHDISTVNRDDKAQADLLQKNQGPFSDYFPAVWWQPFEGGNVWITTLGHNKDNYSEPVYRNHLLQGIRFIASRFKGINYANARATTKDDPLKK